MASSRIRSNPLSTSSRKVDRSPARPSARENLLRRYADCGTRVDVGAAAFCLLDPQLLDLGLRERFEAVQQLVGHGCTSLRVKREGLPHEFVYRHGIHLIICL